MKYFFFVKNNTKTHYSSHAFAIWLKTKSYFAFDYQKVYEGVNMCF